MALTERLAFVVDAKTGGAVREFNKVAAEVDKLGQETTKTGGLLGRLSTNTGVSASALKAGLASAAVAAGGALVKFGADGVRAASNLEQSVGAVESVFGKSSEAIFKFGETAANTAGLSKREVNEMAAVLGAQLQGMGFTAEKAADEVLNLEKRAADMAATFGGSTKDAVEAISATLRGERDPIERYGVSLKDVDVKARIAALGLDTSTVAAEKQATAVASLSLVMEGTAKTQGQFSRESDTLAGAQSRLNASVENLQAAVGEGLTPALENLATAANAAIGPLTKLLESGNKFGNLGDLLSFANPISAAGLAKDKFDQFRSTLDGTAEEADDVATAAGGMVPPVEDAADAAEEADKNYKKLQGSLIDAAKANRSYDSAQRAVASAQLGVVDAQRNLNELLKKGAVDAREVAAAERAVADASRAVADAEGRVLDIRKQIERIEAGPSAEDQEQSAIDLARAQDRVGDSEANLARIREESPDDIEAIADAELDLRQAKLDLVRVEQEQQVSTEELDQARRDLAEAEQGVVDAQTRAKDSAEALRKAQAGDPEFNDRVTDAKWRLVDAHRAVDDAQFNAGIAAIGLRDSLNAQKDAVTADADAVKRLREELYLLGISHPVVLGLAAALGGQTTATAIIPGTPTTANVQRRASGGPVSGGRPYIVGEEGPELFVPGSSGGIVPNGALGGGGNVYVTVNALDPESAGNAVVAALRIYNNRSGPAPIKVA